jgi:hypothetical protein
MQAADGLLFGPVVYGPEPMPVDVTRLPLLVADRLFLLPRSGFGVR